MTREGAASVENAFIERFNGRLPDEYPNANFRGLEHARLVISEWAEDYNGSRPKPSTGGNKNNDRNEDVG